MTWSLLVVNQSSYVVVAPDPAILYGGNMAMVAVLGVGTITLTDIGGQPGHVHSWGVRVESGGFVQDWYYDGQGACVLTINADGTFTVSGQNQSFQGKIGGGPGVLTRVPALQTVYLVGYTNAVYTQRATILVDRGQTYTWTGSGEGNRRFVDTLFTGGRAAEEVNVVVLIEHATDGTTFQPSIVSDANENSVFSYRQLTIVSEDGVDDDYNDCAIIMSWWAVGAQARKAAARRA